MKKHLFLFALALALSLFATVCHAQDDEQPASQKITPCTWVSDKGYWVIENNVRTPKQNTVYFYNPDNILVYKEKIDGMKIKVNKRNVCMRLKAALEQAVTVWEATHVASENQTLVAVALKN